MNVDVPEGSVLLVFPSVSCAVKIDYVRGLRVLDYMKNAGAYHPMRRCELNGVHARHSTPVPDRSVLVIFNADPKRF